MSRARSKLLSMTDAAARVPTLDREAQPGPSGGDGESLLDAVIDSLADGLVVSTAEGTRLNAAARRLLDLTDDPEVIPVSAPCS